MIQTQDLDYYRQRAEQETLLAANCDNECAREAHRRMAEEYRRLADEQISSALLERPDIAADHPVSVKRQAALQSSTTLAEV